VAMVDGKFKVANYLVCISVTPRSDGPLGSNHSRDRPGG
jgi:hypothetical protein